MMKFVQDRHDHIRSEFRRKTAKLDNFSHKFVTFENVTFSPKFSKLPIQVFFSLFNFYSVTLYTFYESAV